MPRIEYGSISLQTSGSQPHYPYDGARLGGCLSGGCPVARSECTVKSRLQSLRKKMKIAHWPPTTQGLHQGQSPASRLAPFYLHFWGRPRLCTVPAGVRTGRLWQAPCLARCGSVIIFLISHLISYTKKASPHTRALASSTFPLRPPPPPPRRVASLGEAQVDAGRAGAGDLDLLEGVTHLVRR